MDSLAPQAGQRQPCFSRQGLQKTAPHSVHFSCVWSEKLNTTLAFPHTLHARSGL